MSSTRCSSRHASLVTGAQTRPRAPLRSPRQEPRSMEGLQHTECELGLPPFATKTVTAILWGRPLWNGRWGFRPPRLRKQLTCIHTSMHVKRTQRSTMCLMLGRVARQESLTRVGCTLPSIGAPVVPHQACTGAIHPFGHCASDDLSIPSRLGAKDNPYLMGIMPPNPRICASVQAQLFGSLCCS